MLKPARQRWAFSFWRLISTSERKGWSLFITRRFLVSLCTLAVISLFPRTSCYQVTQCCQNPILQSTSSAWAKKLWRMIRTGGCICWQTGHLTVWIYDSIKATMSFPTCMKTFLDSSMWYLGWETYCRYKYHRSQNTSFQQIYIIISVCLDKRTRKSMLIIHWT